MCIGSKKRISQVSLYFVLYILLRLSTKNLKIRTQRISLNNSRGLSKTKKLEIVISKIVKFLYIIDFYYYI